MDWFDWAKEYLEKWKARQEIFTPRALRVFATACKEAKRLKHNYIGTEHLLLGILTLNNGVAVDALKSAGLTLEAAQLEIEKESGLGSETNPRARIPFTPRAKRVIEAAQKDAKTTGKYCSTEHLLLGLLKEDDGLAARIFKEFNVEPDQMRQTILNQIASSFRDSDKEPKKEE